MADGATGVDVSWLRHSHKAADQAHRTNATPPSGMSSDPPPPKSAASTALASNTETTHEDSKAPSHISTTSINGHDGTSEPVPPGQPSHSSKHLATKRSHLKPKTSNGSIEKMTPDSTADSSVHQEKSSTPPRAPGSRRNSWITNLSSKFSSSPLPSPGNAPRDSHNTQKQGAPSPKVEKSNPFDITIQPPGSKEEPSQPYVPAPPKTQNSSFLSSALRRLSSGSTGLGRLSGSGSTAQRRVMNLDPNRERCKVPELERAKLKRVSFCVDVEIAGYARSSSPEDGLPPPTSRPSLQNLEREVANRKKKDASAVKKKDAGEGAALKNPEKSAQEKETDGVIQANKEVVGTSKEPKPQGEILDDEPDKSAPTTEAQPTKKKEKKKRSEAERKERKERKRRLAEANGTVPLELTINDDDDSSGSGVSPPDSATGESVKPQTSPTTDPLRIYKRCASLRETPALKKILDQISETSSTLAESPGTVAVLDLTGVWMQFADIVTLGDWLAIVPVRKLILENCGLTDDAVRIILSGLLSCKTPEQAKHNKKLAKKGGLHGQEMLGVIEKVSLKDNSKITRVGWEHIGLFLHMSKTLKAIDLSGIPFPRKATKLNGALTDTGDGLCSLISQGLAERFAGNRLEELIMSQCSLSSRNVSTLVDGAIGCGLRRLGLAENDLSSEALEHVVRYVKSGVCEGLDLGGNPQLHGQLQSLSETMTEESPLLALSLAACDLDTTDLAHILPASIKLPNFRFIDLSHNRGLFASQPNALSLFRKYLPQLRMMKRIHLSDVDLSADDAIAIAEVLPECSMLAHVSLIENRIISALAGAKDSVSQEEACAIYASLMTAVRCSHSIVAIDIEVPSADSSEVVKALASQIVAYSLRNLERFPLTDGEQPPQQSQSELGKSAPDVLLHLVGHMEGYEQNYDSDEPTPDEDYYISATGVVKALGVCLGTADHTSRGASREISPAASGTATPRRQSKPLLHKKPKDMSKELLESARKIRFRLRPALLKEDRLGNDTNYRRLQFLDSTLERIIQRFEDEYPETRLATSKTAGAEDSSSNQLGEPSVVSESAEDTISKTLSDERIDTTELESEDPYAVRLSRRASNTSLRTRALDSEEGQMHRFGQQFRRSILKPEGLDYAHGTNEGSVDPPHLAVLRARIEALQGEEIRRDVLEKGYERVLEELGANAGQLAQLELEDPEGFQKFKEAQAAVEANNMTMASESDSSGVNNEVTDTQTSEAVQES